MGLAEEGGGGGASSCSKRNKSVRRSTRRRKRRRARTHPQSPVQESPQQLPPSAHHTQLRQHRINLPRVNFIPIRLRRLRLKCPLTQQRTPLLLPLPLPHRRTVPKPIILNLDNLLPHPSLFLPIRDDSETEKIGFGEEGTGDGEHLSGAVVFFDDGLVLCEDEGDGFEEGREEGGEVGWGLTCECVNEHNPLLSQYKKEG